MNKKILLSLIVLFLIAAPAIMNADISGSATPGDLSGSASPGTSGTCTGICNPLKVNSVGGLVQNAVQIFSYIAVIIAVLAFIWVGLQYILARGKPDEMKRLTGWLGWIAVGVAIIIGANVIVNIVISTLESTGVVDPKVIQSAKDAASGR